MDEIGDRVLVIGCAGAGKTVFAQRLSRATGLPLVNLDREFWQAGWIEPDKRHWAAKVEELIARPRWIMDGNYLGTLALRLTRGDTVIFLDPPRLVCLWRAMARMLRNLGRTRADMAPNCPERFDWEFVKYIWNFASSHRPRVMEILRGFDGTLMVYENSSDAESFVISIERSKMN